MTALLMAFRLAAIAALLLGLGFLFDLLPLWLRDVHMLAGIIAVLIAIALGIQIRTAPALLGALLGLVVLGLGVQFRISPPPGTPMGLVHLAAAIGMTGLIEAAAARSRRAAGS